MNIITINDLCFDYEEPLFEHFNLEVKEGTWLTLMGPNGSGKSTLIKILTGVIKTKTYIVIDGSFIKDSPNIARQKVGVVFDNPNNTFVAETVYEEIAFVLENQNQPKNKIRNEVNNIAEFLNIKSLLRKSPIELSNGEKCLVTLAAVLVAKPKILIVDELLDHLDYVDKLALTKILRDLNKDGLTVINVTHDIEQSLLGDELLLLKQGKLVAHDSIVTILRNEKLLKSVNLKQPFMLELSDKLKLYDLIDSTFLDMKGLVRALWK